MEQGVAAAMTSKYLKCTDRVEICYHIVTIYVNSCYHLCCHLLSFMLACYTLLPFMLPLVTSLLPFIYLACYHFVNIYVATCYHFVLPCYHFVTIYVTTCYHLCYHMLSLLQVLLPFMLSLVTTLFIICYHMLPLLPVLLPLPLSSSIFTSDSCFLCYQKSTKRVDKSVRSFIWY